MSVSVLVVGGGITGSVLSLALAQRGAEVDLVEITPRWHGVGHGITVQGNLIAALGKVGVADEVMRRGVPFNRLRMRKADGSLIAEVPTPHTGGTDLPATMGALRSDIQDVLCEHVYAAGVTVRLGLSIAAVSSDADGAHVQFTDGSAGRYDLVVADIMMPGLDGIALALKIAQDYPDTRVLMITGYAAERQRAHNLDSLIHKVIAKPFSLEEIIQAVSDALSAPARR